jgi:hypothetical protein
VLSSPLSSSPSPIREEFRLTAELKADVVHQKDDEASEPLATTQPAEDIVCDELEPAAGATAAMPDVTVMVPSNSSPAQATSPKAFGQEEQPSSASQKSATSEEEDEELAAYESDGSEPTAAAAVEITAADENDSNHGAAPMQVDSVDE